MEKNECETLIWQAAAAKHGSAGQEANHAPTAEQLAEQDRECKGVESSCRQETYQTENNAPAAMCAESVHSPRGTQGEEKVSGNRDVPQSKQKDEIVEAVKGEMAALRQEKAALEEAVQQLTHQLGELAEDNEALLRWKGEHSCCSCRQSAEAIPADERSKESQAGCTDIGHEKNESCEGRHKDRSGAQTGSTSSASAHEQPSTLSIEEEVGDLILICRICSPKCSLFASLSKKWMPSSLRKTARIACSCSTYK